MNYSRYGIAGGKYDAFLQFFFRFLANLEIYAYICPRNILSNPQNKK